MAEEFNLEDSNAYFASDKLKDFVKRQTAFDKLMLAKSALPIAAFDFFIGYSAFWALQAVSRHGSVLSALFFTSVFCIAAYSQGMFSLRARFDRWQSLLLSLRSWILAYAFTLGFSPLWLAEDSSPFVSLTIAALIAGLMMYMAHWYLARGLRHHAFHFVILGEASPTTISLLKEVRRPREVVSYRHIHKLYHLISSQKILDTQKVLNALIESEISVLVLTSRHQPSPSEELLLLEAQRLGIICVTEDELWEDITKCAPVNPQRTSPILQALLQINSQPGQAAFRRLLDACLATVVLLALFPVFALLYIVASLRLGKHALVSQKFMGLNRNLWEGNVLVFSGKNFAIAKELKVGQHGQGSFFERWCWKSGMWKYPLLWNVVQGDLSLVGSPLKAISEPTGHFQQTLEQKIPSNPEAALAYLLDREIKPGIVSHFELTEQEPTYFESSLRSPDGYTLYYQKNRSLLLDGYLITLCLIHKIVGRSPQRTWLKC